MLSVILQSVAEAVAVLCAQAVELELVGEARVFDEYAVAFIGSM
ncbi:hypothetical protein [Umezawaea tangerina]|nr:hypothetical protein [Umezawaea tangerina]